MTRLVSIDFETTGTVAGWENEPWQLGCVEVVDGEPVAASRWETYFRIPVDRPFSPRAPGRWAQIRAELAAAPSFAEMWPELSARLQGVPLVAHNAATERTILVKRAPLAPFGPWFDTLRLVRRLVRAFGLQMRVDALCPDRTWHDALYDACAGAVLFSHILHVAGWNVVCGEAV